MGLVELTQDLSNFKWTNYAKVGSSTSALSGRHIPVENVPPQTEQMESAFGQITSAVDFFSNVNAQGFTKFFISKDNSQFIGITEEGYAYPMSNGVSLGIENDVPTTDYFSGIQGTWGPNTLPLGFTKNMVIDSLLAPTSEGSDIPILSLDTLRHTIPAVGLSPSFTIDYSRYDVLLGSQFNSVDGIISSQYTDSEQLHSSYGTEFHISGFSRGDMYIANIDEPSTPEYSIFTRGSAGLGRITFDSPYFGEDVFLSDIPYAIPEVTTTGPTTSPISAQVFDNTPIAENAHGSDFMTVPLENYLSQFSAEDLQTDIDSGFNRGDMYIIDHPHQSHPTFKTFTQGSAGLGRIDLTSPNFDPWTFEDDIPYVIPQHDSSGPTEFTIESFDDTPIAENAHGSDFFTTPLANYTSQFSAEDLQTDIDSGFDRGDMYITDHPHQSHPTFKTFTRGSAGLGKIGLTSPNFNPFEFGTGLPYVIPQHTSTGPEEFTTVLFDDTPEVANAHGSDYLTLPLIGYTSQFQPNTGNWGDYGIAHSTDIFHTLELENSKFYTAFGKSPSTNFYFNPPFTHLSLNQTPFLYEYETEEQNGDGSPIFETAFGWKGGSIHIPSDVSAAAVLGGGVSYYGSLVPITPRSSIYRAADGTYQVPQLEGNTLPPGETSGIPLFEGTQITHNISTDYTFDTQLGLGSPLFGNLGWTSTGTYVGTITLPPTEGTFRSQIQDVYEDNSTEWAGLSSINTDTPQSEFFGTDFEGAAVFNYVDYRDKTYTFYQNHYLSSPFENIALPGLFGPTFNLRARDTWTAGSIHISSDQTEAATPWGDMTFPEATKERKVYQHHFLTSPFTPITVGTDLFDETGATLPWSLGSIHIVSGDIQGAIHSRFRTSVNMDYTDMEDSKFYTAFGKSPSTNFYFNPPFSHMSLDISPFRSVGIIDPNTGEVSVDAFESKWRQGSIQIPSDQTEAAASHPITLYHEEGHTIGVDKQRKVYQHHFLNSPFQNIPLSSSPFALVDADGDGELEELAPQWKLGSIHIDIGGGDTTEGVWDWSLHPAGTDSDGNTFDANNLSRVNLGRVADGVYDTFPYGIEDDSRVPPSTFRIGDASPYNLQIPPHFGTNLTIPATADDIVAETDMSSLLGTIWNLGAYTAGAQGPSGNLSQFYPWGEVAPIDDNTGWGAPRVSLGKITMVLKTKTATYDSDLDTWTYTETISDTPGASPNFDRTDSLLYFGSEGLFPARLPYVIPAISTTGPWTGNSNVGPFTFLTQLGGPGSSPGLGNIGWSWDLKYGDTITIDSSQLGEGGTWADRVFTSGVEPLTEPYMVNLPGGIASSLVFERLAGNASTNVVPTAEKSHYSNITVTLKDRFKSSGYTSYITKDVYKGDAMYHGGLATLDIDEQYKDQDTAYGPPGAKHPTTLNFHPKFDGDPNPGREPYIIRDIGERWGDMKPGGSTMDFFGRGGFKTQWDRALKDVSRIKKWIDSNSQWLLNQFALQLLQPRGEQRLYNIGLHLGSVLPYVHLPRIVPFSLFINTQQFGPFAGKTYNIPFLGAITIGGKIGDSKYPGSYVSAQDYKDEEGGKYHKNIWLDTTFGDGGENSISFSRLISHTNAFFIGGEDDVEKVLKKRQTLAQLTLMTPGGYSGGWWGFGSVPTRDVNSTKHGGPLGSETGGIHKSDGGKATGTGNKLDAYSFTSYGDIGNFEGEQTGYVVDGSFTKARVSAQKLVDLAKSVDDAEKFKAEKWDAMEATDEILVDENVALALLYDNADTHFKKMKANLEAYKAKQALYGKAVKDIGNQGAPGIEEVQDSKLGTIKKGILGKFTNELTDKINMIPDGSDYPDGLKDFVKFKFKDVVGGRFIIFRAILNSISDSITPEYAEERYVGRPDKVYVYQGADREISFNFSVYPKTKQELPVLWDKLNYLVGLCYPSMKKLDHGGHGLGQRMISPFITLTIGDMFNNAAGLLSSLSITVEDNTTWEIQEGLQLPKYISADCTFKYIGNNELTAGSAFYDHKRITFPENVVAETVEGSSPAP